MKEFEIQCFILWVNYMLYPLTVLVEIYIYPLTVLVERQILWITASYAN